MVTSSTFLAGAELATRKAADLALLLLLKFLLGVVGHSLLFMVVEAQQPTSSTKVSDQTHNHAVMLQQAGVPCPGEVAVRQMSSRLGQTLLEAGTRSLPDMATVRALLLLAWAASAGDLQLDTPQLLREVHARQGGKAVDLEYSTLARESLEVLTLAISLCPTVLDSLAKDKTWHGFLVDLVLLSPESNVRDSAAEQFLLICTRATSDSRHVKLMVNLLFTVMQSLAQEWAEQSAVHFLLLARLLSFLSSSGVVLSNCSAVLTKQIDTLTMGRESVLRTGHTATPGVGASG